MELATSTPHGGIRPARAADWKLQSASDRSTLDRAKPKRFDELHARNAGPDHASARRASANDARSDNDRSHDADSDCAFGWASLPNRHREGADRT